MYLCLGGYSFITASYVYRTPHITATSDGSWSMFDKRYYPVWCNANVRWNANQIDLLRSQLSPYPFFSKKLQYINVHI